MWTGPVKEVINQWKEIDRFYPRTEIPLPSEDFTPKKIHVNFAAKFKGPSRKQLKIMKPLGGETSCVNILLRMEVSGFWNFCLVKFCYCLLHVLTHFFIFKGFHFLTLNLCLYQANCNIFFLVFVGNLLFCYLRKLLSCKIGTQKEIFV